MSDMERFTQTTQLVNLIHPNRNDTDRNYRGPFSCHNSLLLKKRVSPTIHVQKEAAGIVYSVRKPFSWGTGVRNGRQFFILLI